jgi:lipopolysaccharide transport protein LptA
MANSLLSIVCAGGLAVAWSFMTVAAQSGTEELLLDADSFSFDSDSNLVHMRAPHITQGDLRIRADEAVATGINFDQRSEWRFTGNVRIEVASAVMRADSAVFVFDDERLSGGELAGSPATFEDPTSGQSPISGSAGKLAYDSVGQTLRLMGDAWLRRERTEVTGCDLIYDFASRGLKSGATDCGGSYSFRVLPKSDDAAAPAPAPE